jgi:hypothetical protein
VLLACPDNPDVRALEANLVCLELPLKCQCNARKAANDARPDRRANRVRWVSPERRVKKDHRAILAAMHDPATQDHRDHRVRPDSPATMENQDHPDQPVNQVRVAAKVPRARPVNPVAQDKKDSQDHRATTAPLEIRALWVSRVRRAHRVNRAAEARQAATARRANPGAMLSTARARDAALSLVPVRAKSVRRLADCSIMATIHIHRSIFLFSTQVTLFVLSMREIK